MDRREVMAALGALGTGLTLSEMAKADHDGKAANEKVMAPLSGLHAHFCGIHVAKNNPRLQLIAQHYCGMRNKEMHQCLLFDSCEKDAKLLGVEYIISDRLFRGLSDKEKKYWHPHTYEVLAGGLIAPAMTAEDELKFMKVIINTWGKTWHTWPDPTTELPTGEPLLMWALTADGQEDKKVIEKRDKQFSVATDKIRAKRLKEFGLEVPKVPFPKSMETIGRQWTESGEDKPTSRP